MGQVVCPVLVARDDEVSALDEALDGLSSGRGAFVSISGPAGIGKSRLVRELIDRARVRGVRVVTGRAVPASVISPYRPIVEALLQLLRGIPVPADDGMATWLPHLAGLVPDLVPSTVGEREIDELSSVTLRGEAVIQLFRRMAGNGLVVVLEDLHWADPDTVALIEYIADNLVDEPVVVAATVRSEARSPALELDRRQRSRRAAIRLVLDALDRSAVDEMVRACGGATSPEKLGWIRDVAEGVPLLVEDLLASPGLPESIAASVRERLDALGPHERSVIEAAAVLGRHFDWELLLRITGRPVDSVTAALARAVESMLVVADADTFRFRHAVTREGVLATLLPPHHRALAASALSAIDQGVLSGSLRDLAADLAVQAGQPDRAAVLLVDSGRQSLELGAVQTAIDTLRRAVALAVENDRRVEAELLLVEALAAAGRVDDVADVARALAVSLGDDRGGSAELRALVELRVAGAAVAATRWLMAKQHLKAAEALVARPSPQLRANMAVLQAEVAFADDDPAAARRHAEAALAPGDVEPSLRCHALELIGRAERLRDLDAARAAFSAALELADRYRLPLSRLHALHELGTLDMFEHVGTERLSQARRWAEEVGALSTVAVLDLQLSACLTSHWDLEGCDRHAHSALSLAEQFGLEQVRAKALAMLAGSASMRADLDETTRLAARTVAAAPADRMLEGFTLASIGMCRVLRSDIDGALDIYGRGMAVLARLPNAEPASNRALWPLVLAAVSDRRAASAIDEARRLGVGSFNLNRGLLLYAEAVLAGNDGDRARAERLATMALPRFVNCDMWAVLARFLAAVPARTAGWGTPERWLTDAADVFAAHNLAALSDTATRLGRAAAPNPWVGAGVTNREADVLRLIGDGLTNKGIADRLGVSPRTVEKHVESLLRKTRSTSRVELAIYATTSTT